MADDFCTLLASRGLHRRSAVGAEFVGFSGRRMREGHRRGATMGKLSSSPGSRDSNVYGPAPPALVRK
jgi:hypothetical protein